MNHLDLWPLAWDALEALTIHYGPAINHAAEELGIPAGQWYGWLMAARIFEPDPVSAASLHVRAAYRSPDQLAAALAQGVRLGLLASDDAGQYRLTPAGHAGVRHLIEAAYAAMAPLQPLPEADLLHLAGLLRRLVEASLAAPEPPARWSLRIERRLDPGRTAPVMERLDQHLSDLAAYRDDSHLAAWRPYGVSGQAWEAFTLLWRGAARTVDELAAKLARRGYMREDYAAAVDELARRNWVTGGADSLALTAEGRAVREEAERTTDAYFYRPWSVLSEAEVAELRALLIGLRDGLLAARR